jgi:hypothetical protein
LLILEAVILKDLVSTRPNSLPTQRPWSYQASPLEITLILEDGKASLENVVLEIRIAAYKGNRQVNAYTI